MCRKHNTRWPKVQAARRDLDGAAGLPRFSKSPLSWTLRWKLPGARREPSRAAPAEKPADRGPLPGQSGIAISHGRWVQALDLNGAGSPEYARG